MSSSEFYDNFISYQIDSGINDRIYTLYKKLCKIGISSGTNILEIGCGIGIMTYLLSHKIKKGRIIAMDISPKSIDDAKKYLTQPNLIIKKRTEFVKNPLSDERSLISRLKVRAGREFRKLIYSYPVKNK